MNNTAISYNAIRALVYQQLQVPVYTQSSYANSNIVLPAIIFSRSNTSTTYNYMGMDNVNVYTDNVTFSIQDKTIESVETIRDFLIGLLDGYESYFALDSETNSFSIETGIYNRDVNFTVIYKQ